MSSRRWKYSPPIIGIDGYNLGLDQGTGIATYARNLSYAAKALGAEVDVVYGRNIPSRMRSVQNPALLREISFFDAPRPLNITSDIHGLALGLMSLRSPRVVPIPVSGQVVTDHFHERLPAFTRLWNARNLFERAQAHFAVWGKPLQISLPNPPAVMHWTYPLPIEMAGSKNVYTIHDLIPLRLPHTTVDHKRRFLKLVQAIGKRADHIITVSETSRDDIMNIMGVAPDRVTNTYQAAEFAPMASRPAKTAIWGAVGLEEKDYYLFFGAIEPKKNVGRLIEGFLTAQVASPLLIVGKKAWKSEQELQLLPVGQRRRAARADAPRGDTSLVQLDYVPQSLLVSLIRGAKAVIFPSIYEGFGLPVLEAMQLGVPVITSSVSSLPEVAGDAALLVDPYNPRAIADAVRRLDSDAGLRAELSARGLVQARKFSPDAYRQRLGDLYARLGVVE